MAEWKAETLATPGRLVATQVLQALCCQATAAIDVLDRKATGDGPFYTDQQKISAARTVFDGMRRTLEGLTEGAGLTDAKHAEREKKL